MFILHWLEIVMGKNLVLETICLMLFLKKIIYFQSKFQKSCWGANINEKTFIYFCFDELNCLKAKEFYFVFEKISFLYTLYKKNPCNTFF